MTLVLIIPEGFDVVAGASAPVGMSGCGLRHPFRKRGVSVELGPLQVQPWWGGSRRCSLSVSNGVVLAVRVCAMNLVKRDVVACC